MRVPEQYRLKNHPKLGSDSSCGNNGFFIIPHYRIGGYELRCQVSDGMGWEHVSVTVAKTGQDASRCPTWEEMCHLKEVFWGGGECVVQYHPQSSEYVNNHPYCLHLWRPIGQDLPQPESIMVGKKEFNL
jgi:hypothetical protein